MQLQQAISQAKLDLKQLSVLDRQIKTYGTASGNPYVTKKIIINHNCKLSLCRYTWVTLDALDESMQNVTKMMKVL